MPRKCKSCGDKFTPTYNTLQSTCGKTECAIAHGRKLQDKQRTADYKQRKKAFRDSDRPWHLNTLEAVFNKYIKLRDKTLPCISCGTYHAKTTDYRKARAWQAGHFRSKGGFLELRFDELNVHKECLNCNCYDANHLEGYRRNLIDRIGLEKVELLEGPHEPKKYKIPELQDLIKHYRQKNKSFEETA